jgi:Lipase (class 3)
MAVVDNQLTLLMLELAAQGARESLITSGASLPQGWVQLKTFKSPPTSNTTIQGLLAMGPLNEDYDMAVVLALGITWTDFYKRNTMGVPKPPSDRLRLPSAIVGTEAPPSENVAAVFGAAYNTARESIWNSLSFIESQYRDYPVYVTGMGLGSTAAQICSVDFRKGNPGPAQGKVAPDKSGPCFVFSAPNFANTSLVNYINGLISQQKTVEQFVIHAATTSLVADFFPTAPNNTDNAMIGEGVLMETIKLPAYDEPWWERSDIYYIQSLDGTPPLQNTLPLAFSPSPPPANFSQPLAFTAAQTVAASYQLAQHPDGSTKIDNSAFTLNQTIKIGGKSFAAIYTSFDTVIVAIRGPVTFSEYYGFSCLTTTTQPSFAPARNEVHTGTLSIYNSPTDTKDVTFAQALINALKSVAPGKKLVLAGHDLGGAIAGLAATDYSTTNYGFTLDSLYTFGSTWFANSLFVDFFKEKVGAKSYQLYRTKDTLMKAIQLLGFFAVTGGITMGGQLALEEPTYHAITNYCNLLNPQAKFYKEQQ